MTEEYITDALEMLGAGYKDQPAAIIDQPRNIKALNDTGLYEYKAWGWVKLSAKFIAHLRHLKGAKLAIWQCIALSIDETGTCKMTLKDIGALTDYSHTEVIESIKELETAGYLTVNKDGKTNIYQPVFVARGENKPQETLVKKLESTPAYQYESSPAIEKSDSSIIRVKRVKSVSSQSTDKKDLVDGYIEYSKQAGWRGRELIRDNLLVLADWYNKVTGQEMTKRVQKTWYKALQDWSDEGIRPEHLQIAYDAQSKWRVVNDPNQLTKDACAIKASGAKSSTILPVTYNAEGMPESW
jgi:hypothetical protein